MMKIKFIYCSVLLYTLVACNKLEVEPVVFDVTVDQTTYNANDTVTFNFEGNPDYVDFYSGEVGAKYKFSDRKPEVGEPIMNFTSLKTGNSLAKMELFISNDFNGNYEKEFVESATWHNLTADAVFSTGALVSSGDISLKDYNSTDKPVYLAFVSSKPEDVLNQLFTNSIRSLNITNILSDGSTYNVNPGTNLEGWENVNFILEDLRWYVNSSNQLSINSITANKAMENEDWAISGAIDLNRVIPDKAVSIKNMAMTMPIKQDYVFSTPGTYTVSFVAHNQTATDRKEVVKEITITIN